MGKKELVEELDKQLAEAKKTKRSIKYVWVFLGIIILIAFLFPLFWFFALLIFIFLIVDLYRANRRLNEINLEKAKLK